MLSLIISGCATLSPGDIPHTKDQIPPNEIIPQLSCDTFGFRLDLDRETELDDSSGDDDKIDKPYTNIGIYFGNGIFLDSNLNLYVDVIKLLELEKLDYFHIKEISNNSNNFTEWVKDGNEYRQNQNGFFSSSIVMTRKNNIIYVDNPGLQSSGKIQIKENEISYEPTNLIGKLNIKKLKLNGDKVKYPGIINELSLKVKNDENGINIKSAKMLYMDNLQVRYSSHNKKYNFYTMVRSENKYVFYKSESVGFIIELQEDVIHVKNHGQEKKYKIIMEK